MKTLHRHLMSRRRFIEAATLVGASGGVLPSLFPRALTASREGTESIPRCNRFPGARFHIEGRTGDYLDAVTRQWLLVAPLSNAAMIEMFRDRDRRPLRDMVPWAGEFAGKYLTSAVQVWRVTGDESLKRFIADFVLQLTASQADDGYLGPWPKDSRLTGHAPNVGDKGGDTWDAWGHYHVMLGLLLWNADTGDATALDCAKRIGDLFCTKFATARLVDTGSTEMNLAPIHALCLLHQRTGEKRYLELALKICAEFAATGADGRPLAGDYLNAALAGKEFFQFPKPRWESLHPIMGLASLYWITGDDKYRRAFEQIWWSIVKLDRHNNGGFSSGEQAQGNPYHPGAIETCCTIAWIALSVEMLRLTGNSIVADEIELSTLNSVLGLHSPTGRWVTYNTPMDGVRKASAHDIVFQARAGSPELNCCSVNGARGLGMISDWVVMSSGEGVLLNWYGPSTMRVRLNSGNALTLTQKTDYPRNGWVRVEVTPGRAAKFPIGFRIPYWSKSTGARLNGKLLDGIKAGSYFMLDRKWKRGDIVELSFDFSLHFWSGERECANKTSIYHGPILLTYDRRFNEMDPDNIPVLEVASKSEMRVVVSGRPSVILLLDFTGTDGRTVRLCDFASAGAGGSPYRSWLEVKGVTPGEFSRSNPLRSAQID